MIVTRSWLNEFLPLQTLDNDEIVRTLVAIGHEVASYKQISLDLNIVIGRVISCAKHKNADKLTVCQVDVGEKTLQIVCGASNVVSGEFVVVALAGAKLPNGAQIKESVIKEEKSFGMICSASELGLPDLNSGILTLDSSIGKLEAGIKAADLPLLADSVFEVDLTTNRGDCFSVYGLARDLSAAIDLPMIGQKPDLSDESAKGIGRILRLISDPKATASIMFKAFENQRVTVPLIVRLRLAFAQIETKTDIEALTAYVVHTTGVLFRAYDFSAFCRENEERGEIRLIKNHDLNSIVGVEKIDDVGALENELFRARSNSKIIVLLAFFVPPDEISKAAYDHKIKGDWLHARACKGSEPELKRGMRFFHDLISDGSIFFSESFSYEPTAQTKTIAINTDEIGALIGEPIDKNKIATILKRLGSSVHTNGDQKCFMITPAAWRHDLHNASDIAEEIVRIIGIDKIEPKPLALANTNAFDGGGHSLFRQERTLASKAASNGFHESLHFIFCDKERLRQFGFAPMHTTLDISNPIASNLNALRPTLLINLLEAAARNRAKAKEKIALFEIGDIYDNTRRHKREIAFVFSGDKDAQRVENHGRSEAETLFDFARKLARIVGDFELAPADQVAYLQRFQCAKAIVGEREIGVVGKLSSAVAKTYDLATTFVAAFDLSKIAHKTYHAETFSKLQPISRDLSVVIHKKYSFAKIKQVIAALKIDTLKEIFAADIYSDESLGETHSLTIRFGFRPREKTPTEEEIAKITDRVLDKLKASFGAALR
ncbi:MAG: phenylalanine--tRNA ligase subunit beta [Helicobacteraceae bacterium]|jgi:phenylalanyl-tRNA synthetase beta chain|nr:phenylalanine--tRNA ligase subunit beta [Helicobacteraceae bacterium]